MSLDPAILYVDDEAANRFAFAFCFREQFPVVAAAGGVAALELMAERPVAVLLTDQRMPGMTGAELCGLAREHWPETVRMIVTAYADTSATAAAINTGHVSQYIFKPWHEKDMAALLRAGVETYETAVLLRELQADVARSEQQASAHRLVRDLATAVAEPVGAAREVVAAMRDRLDALAGQRAPGPSWRLEVEGLRESAAHGIAACGAALERLEGCARLTPRPRLECRAVSLALVVRVALEVAGPAIAGCGRLELALDAAPRVVAPPAALAKTLVRLLVMMAEIQPAGAPEQRVLVVRTEARDGVVVLELEARGAAMMPALAARLLDHDHPAGPDDPAGADLDAARELVAELGGVQLRQEPGRSACLVLTLRAAGGGRG